MELEFSVIVCYIGFGFGLRSVDGSSEFSGLINVDGKDELNIGSGIVCRISYYFFNYFLFVIFVFCFVFKVF